MRPPTDTATSGRPPSSSVATPAALGRFLYSLRRAASDVDDLVQETFFRAFRGSSSWRGEASFRSWLFTIAGNLLRDEYRRRKGRQMLPLDDRDIADHADPHADLAASEAEAARARGPGPPPEAPA